VERIFSATLAQVFAATDSSCVGAGGALPAAANWASDSDGRYWGSGWGAINDGAWLCAFASNPALERKLHQAGFCNGSVVQPHPRQIRLELPHTWNLKIADCLPWTPLSLQIKEKVNST